MCRKQNIKAIALLTGILIVFAGCKPGAEPPEPEKNSIPHFDIPVSERPRDSFDITAFDSACREFESLLKAEGNEERIFEIYEEIKTLLLKSKNDAVLALCDYDADVTENAERYTAKQNMYSKAYGRSVSLFQSVFLTDYADSFRAYIGKELADKFENAEKVSKEESAVKTKIRELEKMYDALTVRGADTEEFKQLYIEIVAANNAYARARGYKDYCEYAYAKGRDYTVENAIKTGDEVIKNFIPVFRAYVAKITKDAVYDAYKENHDSAEVKFSRLRECVKNISPKLEVSLDHLIRNKLYNADFSANKGQSDYTVAMPMYNDAFIFINPQGKVSDYKTVIHEFGHYSAQYYRANDAFDPNLVMDVEEIMSQGLQLLCCDYYDDYCGEYGTALMQSTVFQIMQAVPKGFAVNEAEYLCYTAENLTAEKADEIWAETNRKYGNPLGKKDGAWTAIPHVFQSPFYYIGYAVSALAAFELFIESKTDFKGSVDKYFAVTELPAGTGFNEALSRAELNNVFEKGAVTALTEKLKNVLVTEREG